MTRTGSRLLHVGCFPLLIALIFGPVPASAEWMLDFYAGPTWTEKHDIIDRFSPAAEHQGREDRKWNGEMDEPTSPAQPLISNPRGHPVAPSLLSYSEIVALLALIKFAPQ